MTRFDTVVVGQELLSEHYLAEEFGAEVRRLRKDWAQVEEFGKRTPRSGLVELAGSFTGELVRARDLPADRRPDALRALYARTRAALCLPEEVSRWSFVHRGADAHIEAAAHRTPSGVSLLVVEADDAATVEAFTDADAPVTLLSPVQVGDPEGALTPEESVATRAVSAVFLASDPTPPAFVLVQAGGWLLLAEKDRWAEGRYLAVDLATAAERRDARAAGELETIAALVGADALVPDEAGASGFGRYLSSSVTHAVGVSKDLREGIRTSIEVVATEVLARRRRRGLPDPAASELRDTALRYLYRVLFLLYAEARPELRVLPVGDPDYAAGYGLDRLRDLTLTELVGEQAQAGTHLYLSLETLFRLVDSGHDGGDAGLTFEALRADLFKPEATALIDEVGLGNAAVQRVLRELLLSKVKRGRERGFVSYGQLGINQLGAAYEGLMAYTGFLAEEDLYEVAKDGDPDKGSWMVTVRTFAGSGIGEEHLVRREDPVTGEKRPARYAKGSFVLRLSGRDRQRSASYYTPQVLTASVVRHSLAELLTPSTPSSVVLGLRVCEPALGSGAFLVEAIDQLAAEYLKRAQAEAAAAGRSGIDPEEYPAELAKVKAYLALHNCYGVDLNATAVLLAEISLWLASMHPGLRAPWFGLRLKRGNSLIGARRAVYRGSDLEKAAWLTSVPDDVPLSAGFGAGRVPDEAVHHFLLPAYGWGAVADTAEAKELRVGETAALKEWRRGVRRALSKDERTRFIALGRRVEALWELATERLRIAEEESRRFIGVWGFEEPSREHAVTREDIESSLADAGGAYRRLRRAMDAWAALWFWPVDGRMSASDRPVAPPTREQWLDAMEAMLGISVVAKTSTAKPKLRPTKGVSAAMPGEGQEDMFAEELTWERLGEQESNDRALAQEKPVADILDEHPWLRLCEAIAEREGFFHWELDFAPVFAAGGFDLQVGNPPWVRPDWDDALVLAEQDPWFALAFKPSVQAVRGRREVLLAYEEPSRQYLLERASMAGTSAHLGSEVDRPILAGLRPDLYRCFIERTWRSMAAQGIVGLIHPESHFTEARAGAFRQAVYEHLRRHWQFRNERKLFEIMNTREYGISIYGSEREPSFVSACFLYEPRTIDESLNHNGTGPAPGVKTDDDDFDVRAHAQRLVRVDEDVLQGWASLIDEPGTPPRRARLLRPVNNASQQVLRRLSTGPRFGECAQAWTTGWDEKAGRTAGFFQGLFARPRTWRDVILQGPHFSVATPFARQPNASMKSNKDYTEWDLEILPADALPTTNYQRSISVEKFIAGYPRWDSQPSNAHFRLAWRRMIDSSTARTVHAALIPPGPTHVNTVWTATGNARDLAAAAGMWASIVVDFLVKVSGSTELKLSLATRLPHPKDHPLAPALILRALRLNCLTVDYAPLWAELYPTWHADGQDPAMFDLQRSWAAVPASSLGPDWTMDVPYRRDADRRQALVEIDALAAIMLDITADELCAIYRTQFGVLRKYERQNRYDANGRKAPPDIVRAYDAHQERNSRGPTPDLAHYTPPFTTFDRETDMTAVHKWFLNDLNDERKET
ncbi:MAG: hypothetical protein U0Q15_06945 [Kineosporiaceae bacterium]